MKRRLIIRRDASTDIEEAVLWYEDQQEGLGSHLRNQIGDAIQRVINVPKSYPIVYNTVRRAGLWRCPYGIYYIVYNERVAVLACHDDRRDPKRLLKRLRDS